MTSYSQTANLEATDSRVKFRRPDDDSIYCVMEMATVEKHRKAGTLEKFLKERRESGVVIKTFRD